MSEVEMVLEEQQQTELNWSWLMEEVALSSSLKLPLFLILLLESSPYLKQVCHITQLDEKGGLNFVAWWEGSGRKYYPGCEWPIDGLFPEVFYATDPDVVQDASSQITKGLMAVWRIREDLQKAMSIDDAAGRSKLVSWAQTEGVKEYRFLKQKNTTDSQSKRTVSHSSGQYLPHGINVTGLPKGQLGVAEDARMAVASLQAANIPFSVYDAPWELAAGRVPTEVDQFIRDEPVYAANLFCLPSTETYRLMLTVGKGYFDRRYNIGAWQWELPSLPANYKYFFNLTHEIWAFSRYAEVMFKTISPVPVHYMPMAVELPAIPSLSRKEYGLPEESFLFFIMFDGCSYVSRKNPLAAVKAFANAFPKTEKNVGLVVKAMNVDANNPEWKAIRQFADSDQRIIIKHEILTRIQTVGLINTCDAYVSLHRAEGFGRIIAESMLLGKPVIVTNHSGNTDFSKSDTAFLVNGPLIPLKDGDYPCWEGQSWCDPNIDEARSHMQTCFYDKTKREIIAAAGQAHIRKYHSAQAVGMSYKKRFSDAGLI